jgi:hypothetical protein
MQVCAPATIRIPSPRPPSRPGAGKCNTIDIMTRHVDCIVNGKTWGVHAVVGCVEKDVAVDIDLDEARRVDLLIEQTIEKRSRGRHLRTIHRWGRPHAVRTSSSERGMSSPSH